MQKTFHSLLFGSHRCLKKFRTQQTIRQCSLRMSEDTNSCPNIVNIRTEEGFQAGLSASVKQLGHGNVVAVPTDTLYGVASLAQNAAAVAKIYDIKQRQMKNPVAICVAEITDLYSWGKVTVPVDLLSDLLPGPVTLIFERTPQLNPALNPNTSLIGIRIPDHRFIRSLCAACSQPLTLTSANISAGQSTLAVQEFSDLWAQLSVICDGGVLGDSPESRLGSTVVDLSVPQTYSVVREGCAYKRTVNLLAKYNLTERDTDR